mmetsp:Transcript_113585/g.226060  ORF Transcript_113585/g.226060 Transcript_113585/m.226060 type:complete len:84 (+) Transcript_113585:169-420(+)
MLLLQQRSPYGLLRNVFVQRSERAHQPLAEQLPSLPEGALQGISLAAQLCARWHAATIYAVTATLIKIMPQSLITHKIGADVH